MKILQLCKKFPYPLKDGESIAVTYLSRALHSLGCDITLLAMNTTKHYFPLNELPPDFQHYTTIHTVPLDNRLSAKDALLNLFSKASYHVSRFDYPEFRHKLIEVLSTNQFDIIQLETLYLAPYIDTIRAYSSAKIVMRSHNVEFEIWERVAEQTPALLKRLYLKYLTTKLKRYEIQQLQAYDLLVAITQRDLDYFKKLGYQKDSMVLPIGLDFNRYQPNWESYKKPLSLSFIGSLDWMPNVEGVQWLIKYLLPKLHTEFPTLKLYIAGRNTPDWLYKKQDENLVVLGEVEDAMEFINDHTLMLVPLFSGSGMRAKILEAMALGRTVITTTVGVEGIAATPNKDIYIANTPEELVIQIKQVLQEGENLQQVGKAARTYVSTHYDNKNLAQQLLTFYKK